ncbi:lysine transporter LysE [Bordetella genomosp. 1]|uniref:Lysine transporter LysE n=1 Tax=Bordetella genomosp. 1 TaxID=1395607 RepID=A0A261RX89_9BORD|nr:LysE family translocator [Bordetella genomosp. 1]MDQ8032430.1 LysE family translocator [Bordetella sp.]OZI29190.1 lysine transporter LysE [Bordetella genomosp. 1]OZI65076.1 lysine transporter LysE [Bordetella genomosp. 1]
MITLSTLSVFIGALAVVYALPGPDMALVLQSSLTRGVRQGVATAAGLALARAAHVTLSACGLAALFRSAPWLYETVRIVGALYLIHIAVQVFRSPLFRLDAAGVGVPPGAWRASMLRGVMGNLLNPKALLFCSVLLPQFVDPQAGPVWSQMLMLGAVLVAVGVVFDVALSLGAAGLSGWLRRHPRAQTVQRWTFSGVLIAFALKLSTS